MKSLISLEYQGGLQMFISWLHLNVSEVLDSKIKLDIDFLKTF